jgi:hypothetical protein
LIVLGEGERSARRLMRRAQFLLSTLERETEIRERWHQNSEGDSKEKAERKNEEREWERCDVKGECIGVCKEEERSDNLKERALYNM